MLLLFSLIITFLKSSKCNQNKWKQLAACASLLESNTYCSHYVHLWFFPHYFVHNLISNYNVFSFINDTLIGLLLFKSLFSSILLGLDNLLYRISRFLFSLGLEVELHMIINIGVGIKVQLCRKINCWMVLHGFKCYWNWSAFLLKN